MLGSSKGSPVYMRVFVQERKSSQDGLISVPCNLLANIYMMSLSRDELVPIPNTGIDIPGWKIPCKQYPPGRKTKNLKLQVGRNPRRISFGLRLDGFLLGFPRCIDPRICQFLLSQGKWAKKSRLCNQLLF